MVIFFIDVIISAAVILKLKSYDFSKFKDSTEKVNAKVKEYLMTNTGFYFIQTVFYIKYNIF